MRFPNISVTMLSRAPVILNMFNKFYNTYVKTLFSNRWLTLECVRCVTPYTYFI